MMTMAAGCVSVMLCEVMQPFASVIVQENAPAARFVAEALVPPAGDQLYANRPVPPFAITVAVASEVPLQLASVPLIVAVSAAGSVIVTLCEVVQPFASVIVHV